MYIEFDLTPRGRVFDPKITAQHFLLVIRREIDLWIQRHGVVGHSQKTIKFTHRLGFDNEQYFSLFSMTWTPEIPYRIVDIVNEKY